ncbi:MAG: hypothetical protein ACM3PY_02545 [Omnitrophica WOR_2 bacterium]
MKSKLFIWDREKRFLILFTLVLFISFSPSKALGQFIAIFCLSGLLFFVKIHQRKNILRYAIIFLAYSLIGVLYLLALPEFSFTNFFLFLVTASSVLIWFFDFRPILTPDLIRKLTPIILSALLIEAFYGIAQGIAAGIRYRSFDTSIGDAVRGTIEPAFFTPSLGGNVIFVILISTLLIFALGISHLRFTKTRIFVYGIVCFAWLIASALHTILFFGAAVLFATLLIKKPRRDRQASHNLIVLRNSILTLAVCLGILLPIVLPRNFSTIRGFLSYNLDIRENAYSEKARATYVTIFKLPQDWPLQPIIGVGPGQYSSRAALIRTGQYIQGTSIPLSHYTSTLTDKYILTLWQSFLLKPGHGSTYFPFYSWMSLYGEMGILGILIAIYSILRIVINLRKWNSKEFPGLNLTLIVLLFYIALLGLQDNYWEFTQAIFPAFIMLSLGYQYLKKENEVNKNVPLNPGIKNGTGYQTEN